MDDVLNLNNKKRRLSSEKSISTEDHQLDKLDILIINQGWNDKNEKFIVSIGENASSYKYMHQKVSSKYITFDNVIKIFITIGSIIIAADSFTIIFQESQIASIIQKVITVVLALTTIVYNFLNYVSLSSEHSNYASSFGVLYHDIRNIMCLYRNDRPNAIKYIQSAIKKYDHLEINGPNIPNWQFNDFRKKFKDKISIPDIADRIHKIEIIQEPNKQLESNKEEKTVFNLNNDSNLTQIQECFKINGDLSENDNLTKNDLIKRKRNLNKQSDYQYERFIEQSINKNGDDIV